MEGSICSAFVYPVITDLSTPCEYTIVLAGAALAHRHTHHSSHRGEPVHRKLGV